MCTDDPARGLGGRHPPQLRVPRPCFHRFFSGLPVHFDSVKAARSKKVSAIAGIGGTGYPSCLPGAPW